jgi:S1-C subfamily serine protease
MRRTFLLLALSPALLLAATGGSVREPIDDPRVFSRLNAEVTKLASTGKAPLASAERLTQARRATTSSVQLLPPSAQPLSREEVRVRAAASTVLFGTAFKCDRCPNWHSNMASGVIVHPSGVIATNHHVAATAKGDAMGVLLADGTFLPVVEVLAARTPQDVALVRVDTKGRQLPALPVRTDLPAGADVVCLSNPDGSFGYFTQGIVARYSRGVAPADRGAVWMQVTCDYAKGSSGAAILDLCGNVVGLVSSTNSVYYSTDKEGDQKNFQMVRRNCVPGKAIADLVAPASTAKPAQPGTTAK